ncbi:MAG: hypothetical protein ACOYL5_01180 [Phototrophicaceae bacterium]
MTYDDQLARLHREQLLQEAERARLAAQLEQANPQPNLALLWLGERLVEVGQQLQHSATPNSVQLAHE